MSTPSLYRLATARADRAEDGLKQIDEIVSPIVSNPGCELNTVDLVRKLAQEVLEWREASLHRGDGVG